MVSDAWYSSPTVTEKMRGHIERVRALREARLTTTHVVETFVRQRIIPLKRQDLAYTYTRVTDLNRESVQEKVPPPILIFIQSLTFSV